MTAGAKVGWGLVVLVGAALGSNALRGEPPIAVESEALPGKTTGNAEDWQVDGGVCCVGPSGCFVYQSCPYGTTQVQCPCQPER